MARARNIKPSFFKNETLVELPFEHRLLFVGLWTLADREGRLEDRPKRIKMELFPADNVDIDAGLAGLEKFGFIERYSVDKFEVIHIPNFEKHQNPHHTEKKSVLPAKPDGAQDSLCNGELTVNPRGQDGGNLADSLNPDSLNPDSLIQEQGVAAAPPAPPAQPKNPKADHGTKEQAFDVFWSLYPNKKAKPNALKAWMKIAVEEHAEILKALPKHVASQDWKKDGGKFIPHPATWLNARRWEDEIVEAVAGGVFPFGNPALPNKQQALEQRNAAIAEAWARGEEYAGQ